MKIQGREKGPEIAFEGNISGIKVRVIVGNCKYGSKGVEIETYVPQIYCRKYGTRWTWENALNGVIYKMTQVGSDKESVSVDQLDNAIQSLNMKVNKIMSCREFVKSNPELKYLIFDLVLQPEKTF